jgi:uncharacterized protein YukJ
MTRSDSNRTKENAMIAKFLTKVLPYDGTYVYYDGEKMTPKQAAQCVYFAVCIPLVVGLVLLAI